MDYLDFDELIYNLSESTVYLLGNPDLIALWEDAHRRKKMEYKGDIDAKINSLKPTYLGVVKSRSEYNNKLRNAGKVGAASKYQVRANERYLKKQRKLWKSDGGNKQKVDDFLKQKLGSYYNNKKLRKMNEKMLNDTIRKQNEYSNKLETFPDRHVAAYNNNSNTIHVTDEYDNKNKNVPGSFSNAAVHHELQHWKDHMYLRQKYGKQRAIQLKKKMNKLPYYSRPSEINAHQKGYDVRNGNDEDRTKEYQQRLDNFVKTGKSKEFVPENHKKLQF